MTIAEVLDSVQYVVDRDGQKTAVQLDLKTWRLLQEMLEDLADMAEIEQARQEQEETIPWEQVVTEYQSTHGSVADVQN
jgi:hypothetical protein